jgi:hypothetical protein
VHRDDAINKEDVNMSNGIWRIVIGIVILVHGTGHALFLAPCLGITKWGQVAHSWLLSRPVGDVATRFIGGLLWLLVIGGFIAAFAGLLGQYPWWRPLAAASAGVSLLALALFLGGGDLQPITSAALMDIAILVALLWANWPSADLVGA